MSFAFPLDLAHLESRVLHLYALGAERGFHLSESETVYHRQSKPRVRVESLAQLFLGPECFDLVRYACRVAEFGDKTTPVANRATFRVFALARRANRVGIPDLDVCEYLVQG